MADQELWTQIMMQAQARYRVFDEVLRVTGEIAEALSRDDRVSVQMLLGMRQDEIQHLYENEQKIYRLLDCASAAEREEILKLLRGEGEPSEEESFEKTKVGEIGKRSKRSREKIIELDRAISTKLAGKDSFYAAK